MPLFISFDLLMEIQCNVRNILSCLLYLIKSGTSAIHVYAFIADYQSNRIAA